MEDKGLKERQLPELKLDMALINNSLGWQEYLKTQTSEQPDIFYQMYLEHYHYLLKSYKHLTVSIQ